jgi:hypothetical protein
MTAFRAVGLLCWVLAAVCLPGLSSRAQEKAAPKVKLLLSQTPGDKAPEKASRPGVLRPNVVQEVFVHVKNDDTEDVKGSVALLAGETKLTSQPVTAVAGKVTPVPWPRIGPADMKLLQAKGPVSFQLYVKDQPVGPKVRVQIDRPRNYLDASLTWHPDAAGKNRLEAVVRPLQGFRGPPCRVELVLNPDRIPGLVAGQKKRGFFADTLRVGTKAIYLEAQDLRFEGKEAGNGLVYLNADGYPRAFTFKTTFSRTGTTPETADEIKNPGAVFGVPRYARPSQLVPVQIEVDDLPRAEEDSARVVVEMIKQAPRGAKEEAGERVSELVEYRGERQKRILYAAGGPDGGLTFRPEVTDRKTALDLGSAFGPVGLRLRILDAKDQPITFLDKLDEKTPEVTELKRTVMLDDSAPENLRWVDLPKRVVRGRALLLKATGEDSESGISEVLFWVGRPTREGEIPKDATFISGKLLPVKGKAKEKEKEKVKEKVWSVGLDVPIDQPGLLTVSAQFINGAGLRKNLTATIPVVDPEKVAEKEKKAKKASIAGAVREGDRPQVGVPVELRDRTRKVVANVKTGEGGTFLFKDLDPGTYTVVAAKTASRTRGEWSGTVKEGEQKTGLDIKLYRTRR